MRSKLQVCNSKVYIITTVLHRIIIQQITNVRLESKPHDGSMPKTRVAAEEARLMLKLLNGTPHTGDVHTQVMTLDL